MPSPVFTMQGLQAPCVAEKKLRVIGSEVQLLVLLLDVVAVVAAIIVNAYTSPGC